MWFSCNCEIARQRRRPTPIIEIPKKPGKVVHIDNQNIQEHLDEPVEGTVKATLKPTPWRCRSGIPVPMPGLVTLVPAS